MEPITIAVVLGSAALGAWALSSKKPAGAPGSAEVQSLANITTTTGPKGERVFLPESARNLLVTLASSTAAMNDLQNPFMVEYAPIPGGQAVSPDKSAFGWASSENKARSILAPLYAVTTAAATQRKFLRAVAPGTESELAGPNGIYAVLAYAGALARGETPPGLPPGAPGAVIPTPNAPPTPPAASVPGGPPAPGPAPTPGSPPPPFVPPQVTPATPTTPAYVPPGSPVYVQPAAPPPAFVPGVVFPTTGPIATVVAASGANLRSSANGTKIGALARGSTVRIEGDAGFAAGEQWKQITVMSASPGSNGQVSPGTRAFVAQSTLSTGGGAAVPSVPSPVVVPGLAQLPAPGGAAVTPGDVAKVTAPSGANVRATANGTKTGALATGSTVKILGDAGSAGGYVWKKIQVVTATAGSSGAPPGSGGYVATISLSATTSTSLPGQVVAVIQDVVAVEKVPVGGKLWVSLSSTPLLSSTYTTFASTVDTAVRNEPLTVVETPSLSSPKWVKVKRDKSGKIGYVSVFNVTAARPSGLAGSWRSVMPKSWGGRPSLQDLFEILYENAPLKFQEIMDDKKLFREIVEMGKKGQPHPKLMEALESAKAEMAARRGAPAAPSAAGYYVRSRPAYRRWY